MANRLQLRRDGAQQWANINPILAQGELGIEIDTSRIKIGDGVTPWNSLKYERPLETESNAANTLVKRDADGNFQAGAVTATLIGNASTSTRLANARQIQLAGQVTGSGSFDGSQNLTLTTDLSLITTLPHYNPADPDASDLYTRVRVNSQGRVIGAELASTLANYGITDAQPLDDELTSLASLTTLGLLVRSSVGNVSTRQLTGGAGRLVFTVPDGSSQNPFIDLADTAVVVGNYNVESLTSVDSTGSSSEPFGTETVNATRFSVDRYGRVTLAKNVPIATAVEGSKYGAYDAGVAYNRYDIVEQGGRIYQAIQDLTAGLGAPGHTTGDVGGWRFTNNATIEQKGLASFAQEDFDVDSNGHVTISSGGVDNTQLQNNRIIYTDGNTVQQFELDNELTTSTGHTGFDYLNYIKINDTSGNNLFSANNTDNSNAGGVDINVDTNISGASIKLDRPGNTPLQTIERTAGSLKIHHNVSSATDRTLDIISENAGAGTASINITADEDITISSTNVSNRVNVEGFQFQDDTLSSTAGTMILDPGDDDAATGKVQIRGDLQVDGTTTTVNSTTITVDDPIIVLGGDTTPVADDNKDRGVEFSYYDTQARTGFYGWDENYTDSNIWNGTGGFRFLYNATNTNEVFTGTDAALIAGNLRLTTNTGSTSDTTGTLVVTGGLGLSENAHIGGTVTIAGQSEVNNNVIIKADNKSFNIQTAAGVDKFTVDTDNGNTVIEGTLDVQLETTITDNVIIKADNKKFDIQTAGGTSVFDVDTDNGNVHTDGTLDVDSGVTFNSTLDVDLATTLNNILDVDGISTFHNDIILDTTGKTFKITNGSADRFVVNSTSGNVDSEGTLNVASLVHFESADVPTVTTDAGNNFIIGSADYGALRVDGGGYIAGDVLFNSDIYVNGIINERDLGTTETFNTQNYLRVRYKLRTGVTAQYTPTFAQDNSSNLRVFGGGGIATDLHIGENLFVGKKANSDNIEFSVDEDGNTVIGRSGIGSNSLGTLTVHGDVTLNRDVSLTGSQITLGNETADALTVEATSTFNSNVTLASGQDLLVGGNAEITGNLTVQGTTTTTNSTVVTIDDPIITLGGDTAPNTDDDKDRGIEFRYYDSQARLGFFGWDDSAGRFALYNNATNSSEVFSGTRSGIDAGSIKLFDTTNATNSSSGALIVGGGAGIGLDLHVGDDLTVVDDVSIGGNAEITGTLDVTNDFAINSNKFNVDSITGNTTVAGTFGVSGIATLSSTVNISGAGSNLTVGGTASISNDFDINSTKFTVAAASGNTVIDGTLDVDEATNVTSTLGVTGIITATDSTQSSVGNTYNSDGAFRLTGGASIGKNAAISGDLRVYTNSQLDGTLDVEGVTNFTEQVKINKVTDSGSASDTSASVYTAGGLAVTKKAFIGDDLNVGANNFTVDGPTGNVGIAGTLDVSQASGFSTITASGVAELQSTLNLGGGFNINTNKFNVSSATGTTDIAGQLNVVNAVDFDSTLNVDGNADFNAGIDVTAGNATFAGLVQADNVTDSTGYTDASASVSTDGGLSVKKKAFVGGNFSVGGAAGVKASILAASGNTDIKGTLNVDDAVTLGSTLGVTGQITGDVTGDLTGNADTATQVNVTNTNNNTLFYPAFMGGNTGNQGVFVDSSNLTYNPSSNTLSVNNFVSTTNFEVQGNMNVTGLISFGQSEVSSLANHTTDVLTEGSTNLYFTDERVDDRVNNLFTAGTGITKVYDDAANTYTLSVTQVDIDTDNVTEGSSNLFTTAARSRTHFTYGTGIELSGSGELSVTQGDINTDTVTEGSTNLFTTNTRTRSHFTYGNGIALSAGGELTVTESQIDTDNVTEGSTNLFTTAARTRTHFTYGVGVKLTSADLAIDFTEFDTGSITEGSNLYYTDERVDDRVNNLFTAGTGITKVYDDAANTYTLTVTQSDIDTDNVTEGSTNLFTTAARTRTHFTYGTGITHSSGTLSVTQSDINTDNVTEGSTNIFYTEARFTASLGGKSTADLTEGANLYYTDARADARIAAADTDNLSEGSSNLYFTNARADARIAAADTGDLTEGTNLYYTNARADARVVAGITGKLDASAVSTFGGTLIDDADAAAARTTLGLGTAATTAATAYATAAQGTLAASATQPGDLATVATSGDYDDLSNKPTLGTAAATASTAYATAAQGTKADANDTDIDDIYTQLDTIGNNAAITTVAELKAALLAMVRS